MEATPPSVLRERLFLAQQLNKDLSNELEELSTYTTWEQQFLRVEKGFFDLNDSKDGLRKEVLHLSKVIEDKENIISRARTNLEVKKKRFSKLIRECVKSTSESNERNDAVICPLSILEEIDAAFDEPELLSNLPQKVEKRTSSSNAILDQSADCQSPIEIKEELNKLRNIIEINAVEIERRLSRGSVHSIKNDDLAVRLSLDKADVSCQASENNFLNDVNLLDASLSLFNKEESRMEDLRQTVRNLESQLSEMSDKCVTLTSANAELEQLLLNKEVEFEELLDRFSSWNQTNFSYRGNSTMERTLATIPENKEPSSLECSFDGSNCSALVDNPLVESASQVDLVDNPDDWPSNVPLELKQLQKCHEILAAQIDLCSFDGEPHIEQPSQCKTYISEQCNVRVASLLDTFKTLSVYIDSLESEIATNASPSTSDLCVKASIAFNTALRNIRSILSFPSFESEHTTSVNESGTNESQNSFYPQQVCDVALNTSTLNCSSENTQSNLQEVLVHANSLRSAISGNMSKLTSGILSFANQLFKLEKILLQLTKDDPVVDNCPFKSIKTTLLSDIIEKSNVILRHLSPPMDSTMLPPEDSGTSSHCDLPTHNEVTNSNETTGELAIVLKSYFNALTAINEKISNDDSPIQTNESLAMPDLECMTQKILDKLTNDSIAAFKYDPDCTQLQSVDMSLVQKQNRPSTILSVSTGKNSIVGEDNKENYPSNNEKTIVEMKRKCQELSRAKELLDVSLLRESEEKLDLKNQLEIIVNRTNCLEIELKDKLMTIETISRQFAEKEEESKSIVEELSKVKEEFKISKENCPTLIGNVDGEIESINSKQPTIELATVLKSYFNFLEAINNKISDPGCSIETNEPLSLPNLELLAQQILNKLTAVKYEPDCTQLLSMSVLQKEDHSSIYSNSTENTTIVEKNEDDDEKTLVDLKRKCEELSRAKELLDSALQTEIDEKNNLTDQLEKIGDRTCRLEIELHDKMTTIEVMRGQLAERGEATKNIVTQLEEELSQLKEELKTAKENWRTIVDDKDENSLKNCNEANDELSIVLKSYFNSLESINNKLSNFGSPIRINESFVLNDLERTAQQIAEKLTNDSSFKYDPDCTQLLSMDVSLLQKEHRHSPILSDPTEKIENDNEAVVQLKRKCEELFKTKELLDVALQKELEEKTELTDKLKSIVEQVEDLDNKLRDKTTKIETMSQRFAEREEECKNIGAQRVDELSQLKHELKLTKEKVEEFTKNFIGAKGELDIVLKSYFNFLKAINDKMSNISIPIDTDETFVFSDLERISNQILKNLTKESSTVVKYDPDCTQLLSMDVSLLQKQSRHSSILSDSTEKIAIVNEEVEGNSLSDQEKIVVELNKKCAELSQAKEVLDVALQKELDEKRHLTDKLENITKRADTFEDELKNKLMTIDEIRQEFAEREEASKSRVEKLFDELSKLKEELKTKKEKSKSSIEDGKSEIDSMNSNETSELDIVLKSYFNSLDTIKNTIPTFDTTIHTNETIVLPDLERIAQQIVDNLTQVYSTVFKYDPNCTQFFSMDVSLLQKENRETKISSDSSDNEKTVVELERKCEEMFKAKELADVALQRESDEKQALSDRLEIIVERVKCLENELNDKVKTIETMSQQFAQNDEASKNVVAQLEKELSLISSELIATKENLQILMEENEEKIGTKRLNASGELTIVLQSYLNFLKAINNTISNFTIPIDTNETIVLSNLEHIADQILENLTKQSTVVTYDPDCTQLLSMDVSLLQKQSRHSSILSDSTEKSSILREEEEKNSPSDDEKTVVELKKKCEELSQAKELWDVALQKELDEKRDLADKLENITKRADSFEDELNDKITAIDTISRQLAERDDASRNIEAKFIEELSTLKNELKTATEELAIVLKSYFYALEAINSKISHDILPIQTNDTILLPNLERVAQNILMNLENNKVDDQKTALELKQKCEELSQAKELLDVALLNELDEKRDLSNLLEINVNRANDRESELKDKMTTIETISRKLAERDEVSKNIEAKFVEDLSTLKHELKTATEELATVLKSYFNALEAINNQISRGSHPIQTDDTILLPNLEQVVRDILMNLENNKVDDQIELKQKCEELDVALQKELEGKRDLINELEINVNRANNLEIELKNKMTVIETLNQQLVERNESSNNIVEELSQLKEELKTVKENWQVLIEDVKGEIIRSLLEIEAVHEDNNSLRAEATGSQKYIQELESEIGNMKEDVLRADTSEITVKKLNEQLDQQNSLMRENSLETSSLKTKLNRANQNWTILIDFSHKKIDELSKANRLLNWQLTYINRERTNDAYELSDCLQKLKNLESSNDNLKEELKTKSLQLNSLQNLAEGSNSRYETIISELETALLKANENAGSARCELDVYKENLEALEGNLLQKSKQLANFEGELSEANMKSVNVVGQFAALILNCQREINVKEREINLLKLSLQKEVVEREKLRVALNEALVDNEDRCTNLDHLTSKNYELTNKLEQNLSVSSKLKKELENSNNKRKELIDNMKVTLDEAHTSKRYFDVLLSFEKVAKKQSSNGLSVATDEIVFLKSQLEQFQNAEDFSKKQLENAKEEIVAVKRELDRAKTNWTKLLWLANDKIAELNVLKSEYIVRLAKESSIKDNLARQLDVSWKEIAELKSEIENLSHQWAHFKDGSNVKINVDKTINSVDYGNNENDMTYNSTINLERSVFIADLPLEQTLCSSVDPLSLTIKANYDDPEDSSDDDSQFGTPVATKFINNLPDDYVCRDIFGRIDNRECFSCSNCQKMNSEIEILREEVVKCQTHLESMENVKINEEMKCKLVTLLDDTLSKLNAIPEGVTIEEKIIKISSEIDKLFVIIRQYTDANESLKSKWETCHNSLLPTLNQFQKLSTDCNNVKNDLRSLHDSFVHESTITVVNAISTSCQTLFARIESLEDEISLLQDKLSIVNGQKQSLTEEAASINSNLSICLDKLESLERINAKLSVENDEYELYKNTLDGILIEFLRKWKGDASPSLNQNILKLALDEASKCKLSIAQFLNKSVNIDLCFELDSMTSKLKSLEGEIPLRTTFGNSLKRTSTTVQFLKDDVKSLFSDLSNFKAPILNHLTEANSVIEELKKYQSRLVECEGIIREKRRIEKELTIVEEASNQERIKNVELSDEIVLLKNRNNELSTELSKSTKIFEEELIFVKEASNQERTKNVELIEEIVHLKKLNNELSTEMSRLEEKLSNLDDFSQSRSNSDAFVSSLLSIFVSTADKPVDLSRPFENTTEALTHIDDILSKTNDALSSIFHLFDLSGPAHSALDHLYCQLKTSDLLDVANCKNKLSQEINALEPELSVDELRKLSLLDLQAKLVSVIMDKEKLLVEQYRDDYETKLACKVAQLSQFEEREKYTKEIMEDLTKENEKLEEIVDKLMKRESKEKSGAETEKKLSSEIEFLKRKIVDVTEVSNCNEGKFKIVETIFQNIVDNLEECRFNVSDDQNVPPRLWNLVVEMGGKLESLKQRRDYVANEANREIAHLTSQISLLNQENENIKNDVVALNSKFEALTRDFNSQDKLLLSAMSDKIELEKTIDSMKKDNTREFQELKKEEESRFNLQIKQEKEQINQIKSELANKLLLIYSNVKQISAQLNQTKNDVVNYRNESSIGHNLIKCLKDNLESVIAKNNWDAVKTEKENFERQLKTINDDKTALQNVVAELTLKLTSCQNRLSVGHDDSTCPYKTKMVEYKKDLQISYAKSLEERKNFDVIKNNLVEDLKLKNTTLKELEVRKEVEINQYQQSLSNQIDLYNRLNGKLEEADAKISLLRDLNCQDKKRFEKEIERLTADIVRRQKVFDQLNVDSKDWQKSVASIVDKLANYERLNCELTQQIDNCSRLKEECGKMNDEVKLWERRHEEVYLSFVKTNEIVDKLTKERDNENRQILDKIKEYELLLVEKDELAKTAVLTVDNERSKLNRLSSENSSLRQNLTELQGELTDCRGRLEHLQRQLEGAFEAEEKLKRIYSEKEEALRKCKDLEKRIQLVEKSLKEKDILVEKFEKVCKNVRLEKKFVEDSAKAYQLELMTECEELKKSFEEKETRISQLETLLKENSQSELIESYKDKIETLNKEIQRLKSDAVSQNISGSNRLVSVVPTTSKEDLSNRQPDSKSYRDMAKKIVVFKKLCESRHERIVEYEKILKSNNIAIPKKHYSHDSETK